MADKESLPTRLRNRYAWLDHLVRAGTRYTERYGDHYAAAITYYSVLSLIPLLMLGFSIAGFVLAGNMDLLGQLRAGIATAVPGALGDQVNTIIDKLIDSRGSVGVFGLLAALYSGLGWMTSLRDAVTAQWTRERPQLPYLKKAAKDLLTLIGLGLALVVSYGITAAGSGLGGLALEWLGLRDTAWAEFLLSVATIILGLAANWLVFLWVLSSLPRFHVGWRSAMRGAIAGAVGFEILKQTGNIYLQIIKNSPSGSVFGTLLGLLVFVNLVSRFLVFITAWTATARENMARSADPAPLPEPVVIRHSVQVAGRPDATLTAGLLSAGALIGVTLTRLLRRR
ncbi:inner membrane protein YhjD [Kutzneria buriramensis]|uniref:Membrane protein n=1 Tax=Kutzneria buriramensis TaxID=1045776 RepID=A0A3E0IAB6_9PSEU|nr:inner membrane protein YhjD [Kutzneria buriramensis]REH55668.1 membrane protein [Kutzneria buriramensis]